MLPEQRIIVCIEVPNQLMASTEPKVWLGGGWHKAHVTHTHTHHSHGHVDLDD